MEERKPDLSDDDGIEDRIKEMMEQEEKPAAKSIPISSGKSKKGTSIKVVDHNESVETAPELPKDTSGILATIEEVNKQLETEDEAPVTAAKSIKVIHDEPEEEPIATEETDTKVEEPIEPETAEEPAEEPEVEPEEAPADEAIEEAPSDDEVAEAFEGEDETEPSEDNEKTEEPAEEVADDVTEETPEIDEDSDEKEAKPEEEPKDEDTDKAVDDIMEAESSALLEAEDEKLAKAFDDKKPSLLSRLRHGLGFFWRNKIARISLLVLLVGGSASAAAIPTSRYFALNLVGVRASASVTVFDESTHQPLKNVKVSIAGKTVETDKEGAARLTQLKLGSTTLAIQKRAFAETTKPVTIGWGSNPLGDFDIKPIGTQYVLAVTDFLSGKPIAKVEATSGEASAVSDEKGEIKLTIDKDISAKLDEIEIAIKREGYRDQTVKLNADTKDAQQLKLVAGRKHVFISKRSGKYDVYKIDADTTNEQMLLAGTGTEREDMVLAPHPTEEIVALISTRENKRNSDGFLLSTLTMIDIGTGATTTVAQSERVQVVGWVKDRLVYVQVAAGASAANPKRHRLMSYDYKAASSKEIAFANYFNDVTVAGDKIYYAPSSAYAPALTASVFKVDADGNNRQIVLADEVWTIFRTAYDQLIFSLQQQWYSYKLTDTKPNKLEGQPANLNTHVYVDSPDKKHSLWVDSRDGKGVLLSYDIDGKKDAVVRTQAGLGNPIRWLNNSTAVYRISNGQEVADYVVSLDGGEPLKLRDVTNTSGVDRWYYY